MTIKHLNIGFIIIFVFCTVIGTKLVWDLQKQDIYAVHQTQLDRFSEYITSKLDKYDHIPQLLSKDQELRDALLAPANSAQIEVTNRYLEQVNSVIQAADTYLIDRNGTTIAASNWNMSRTFVGRNFAWRPYFQEALEGNTSRYFALGSTSGQRGYYYSYPITVAAEVIGVTVVKMDLSLIEESWRGKQDFFVVTDPDNVIFMSNQPDWLFKSLTTLSEAQRVRIKGSQQYLDTDIRSLGFSNDVSAAQGKLISPNKDRLLDSYFYSSRKLSQLPLTIRVLTPQRILVWSSFVFIGILTLVLSVAYLTILLLLNRKLKHRQLEQVQMEAKQRLEFQVMTRTAELHAEIGERMQTEKALRQTQEELIQAAKLAVLGQMSASISHELNNPLAAIRSFADNGKRFLEKQKFDRVNDNLIRISALTERMAKISEQLKSYARKTETTDQSITHVTSVIDASTELMSPQIKSNMVSFSTAIESQLPMVEINRIQLEQVLVNLLTNAIQAMEGLQNKTILLSAFSQNNEVVITIEDSGKGVSPHQEKQLFDPFYTTKKNGLGLGLSISHQIIEGMKGKLTYSQSKLGGACFSVKLPIATHK
ncbi:sensor histidine kinase [Vibrio genomosp. F10]|uniref:C4-dicarboxylate transport sensor protein DctB n=3 Tax=Vibrio genomosp. F10 TaxID=723171 RepID=A0A1B9QXU9_9VIBR|nr:ATP-binding protein [Vibrio genomosp. F10]OCH74831.1 ATPase [Vibrio genomosp. F10]OEE36524.1 ATPase [Vibrio genomosp. F10 str. ZF-129]